MKHQAIGVDIGTTGVKAALIEVDGRILADATIEHDLHSPRIGWAEEDPIDWISGTVAALRLLAQSPLLDPAGIAAIGVSGMVPAMVLLDESGQPVRPSIQQNDARAIAEVAELTGRVDQELLYRLTGGRTNQQHIAPRLLWVQRNESDAWRRTSTILGSYDLVTAWLCDASPASCSLELNWAVESGLYDFRKRRWVPELLAAVGLDPSYFPPVHEPTDIVGTLGAKASAETGLPAGIPVVAGSADHIASALAAAIREEGDTLIKFGGAGDILYCSSAPITHPSLFIDAHDIPGKYLLNGCMAASGSLVKWYVTEILGLSTAKATLQELDRRSCAGPGGIRGRHHSPLFPRRENADHGSASPWGHLRSRSFAFPRQYLSRHTGSSDVRFSTSRRCATRSWARAHAIPGHEWWRKQLALAPDRRRRAQRTDHFFSQSSGIGPRGRVYRGDGAGSVHRLVGNRPVPDGSLRQ